MQGPKWPVLLIVIVYETLCGHIELFGTDFVFG